VAAGLAAEIPLFVNATVLLQLAVADQLGVPVIDLHCLALVQAGTATTPSQIAERLGMTTGAVTKMLDRMQAERLVERVPNPDDRRGVLVRPRTDRVDELAGLYRPMAAHLDREIAGGTDDQVAFLAGFVHRSREAAQDEAARLRREGRRHATRRTRPDPPEHASPPAAAP
jgi:DNA-binding MarR family transcriptional regulator